MKEINLGRVRGADGKSAYDIAVKNGFIGEEKEWLESLKGKPGERGEEGSQGKPGEKGVNGEGAYELSVRLGYEGTPEEWLQSLKGETGEPGPRGEKGEPGEKGIQGPAGESGKDMIVEDAILSSSGTWSSKKIATEIYENTSDWKSFNKRGLSISDARENAYIKNLTIEGNETESFVSYTKEIVTTEPESLYIFEKLPLDETFQTNSVHTLIFEVETLNKKGKGTFEVIGHHITAGNPYKASSKVVIDKPGVYKVLLNTSTGKTFTHLSLKEFDTAAANRILPGTKTKNFILLEGNHSLPDSNIKYEKLGEGQSDGNYKVDLVINGKNLFKPSLPFYINRVINWQNGVISDNNSFWTTEFIPISPDTIYTFNTGDRYCLYDSNKLFIKSGGEIAKTTKGHKRAAYVRISGKNPLPASNEIQLEVSSVSTALEPYEEQIIPIKLEKPLGRGESVEVKEIIKLKSSTTNIRTKSNIHGFLNGKYPTPIIKPAVFNELKEENIKLTNEIEDMKLMINNLYSTLNLQNTLEEFGD